MGEEFVVVRERPFYAKYPFLAGLRKYTEHVFGAPLGIKDVLGISEVYEAGLRRVEACLRSRRYVPSFREDLEVLSFYVALLLASATDPWALRKFADSESKLAVSMTLSDRDSTTLALATRLNVPLEYVGSDSNPCGHRVVVGINTRKGKEIVECYPFRVRVPMYLKLADPLLHDVKWKLVNRCVLGGYVYLNKRDAVRILENAIKERVLSLASEVTSSVDNDVISAIRDDVTRLQGIVREVRGFLSFEKDKVLEEMQGRIAEDLFPPCIKAIMESLLRGEHLSHHQRFAIATFLLNIGAGVEYVLNLMRRLPDFNERIARYQVEHLAGIRGSRKKYSVYSCDKMKTLGMCVAKCGVRNPLTYYWRALRKSGRLHPPKHEGDVAEGKTPSSPSQA